VVAEMGRRLGAAGRERVLAHYRWQHSVDEMLRCFEAVIAHRAQRRTVSAGTLQ